MKPVIGVMPLFDAEKDSIWMLPGYLEVLQECGALPVILPFAPEDAAQLLELCDGLLFTGGQDVAPALYGAEKMPWCGAACPQRDTLERALLAQALALELPVFGICRGIQMLNVLLGGSLYQDLETERPGCTGHRMQPPYDAVQHTVTILPDTPFASLLGARELGVNSCHHQGIRTLAPPLRPMALAPDGLVEAVYAPERRFLQAVQWHPEFAWRRMPAQRAVMQAFVAACK